MCENRWEREFSLQSILDTGKWSPWLKSLSDDRFLELMDVDLETFMEMDDRRPPLWMMLDERHRRDLCDCADTKRELTN